MRYCCCFYDDEQLLGFIIGWLRQMVILNGRMFPNRHNRQMGSGDGRKERSPSITDFTLQSIRSYLSKGISG